MKQKLVYMHHMIIEKTNHIPVFYRWGASLALLFFVGGSYLILVHYPLLEHIASKRLAIKQLYKQLTCIHETEAQVLVVSQSVDELRGIFEKKSVQESCKNSVQKIFSYLSTSSLVLKQYHLKEQVKKKEWHEVLEVLFCFSGTFDEIVRLYDFLQANDETFFVKRVKIDAVNDSLHEYVCNVTFSFLRMV